VVHELVFRAATVEDAQAIARVNHLTWLDAYRGLIPDSDLDSLDLNSLTDKWTQNLVATNSREATYVVLVGDSIVAYSRFYPSVDSDDNPVSIATIGSMYVLPDFQCKGIGRRMMEIVLVAIEDCAYVEATLHVLTENLKARKFYESLGWQEDAAPIIAGAEDETVSKTRYRIAVESTRRGAPSIRS